MNGHKCDYRKQWNEEKVNDAVAEVIKKLVNNPKFEAAIRAKINSKIDTGELETEHENLKKQLRQVLGAKNRLGQQMDNLDISDKMYDRKYQDMQDRLNGLYDEIERLESLIDDIVSRNCLLYTSDAADDMQCVDLGGRRIIKKKFFQAEDGIRDFCLSRGLGDVYKRQA